MEHGEIMVIGRNVQFPVAVLTTVDTVNVIALSRNMVETIVRLMALHHLKLNDAMKTSAVRKILVQV